MRAPYAAWALQRWTGETDSAPVRANFVNSPILESWGRGGWENGYGYPMTGLRTASDVDIRNGCHPGDLAQYFVKITGPEETRLLCRNGGAESWTVLR